MTIFHEARLRLRTDLVQQLRTLDPMIALTEDALATLYQRYNDVLCTARGLQDALLDDLEDAQEHGRGPGPIDFAHHLWSRLDLVDMPRLPRTRREDADRLEVLPDDV